MSSSKFATPFFKKSPLHGAYSSGAGGMVPVSYADVHSKFQNDIAKNVAKTYAPKNNSCSNLDQKLADGKIKEGAYKILVKKCAEKNEDEDLKNEVLKNLPSTGTFEFDVNTMEADLANSALS
jgi:hypothetical protein